MRIRLVQLDGKLPNIALMKLAHWHRARGDEVTLTRTVQPGLFEPLRFDLVYGSAIFKRSRPMADLLRGIYPQARVGGTGSGAELDITVEQLLGVERYERYDYGIYPEYPWSIGFTQRGCRYRCPFCVVPRKEGRVVHLNTIHDIWRPDRPRNIVLLDNDFFGQDSDWRDLALEIREGDFRVNFNQGINVRAITEETAEAVAGIRYYDSRFKRRRLHTAWDNLGQEKVFFRGVDRLEAAGIPPQRLMVYMLVGFDPRETMERVLHRHRRLVERGCHAYPMVYDPAFDDATDGEETETPEERAEREREEFPDRPTRRELRTFQRWVIQRYAEFIPWQEFLRGESGTEEPTPGGPRMTPLLPQ